MPIRKTKKGYKWGSKGPFKTKKKAQEVAKAAYASGYKKKKINKILTLLSVCDYIEIYPIRRI